MKEGFLFKTDRSVVRNSPHTRNDFSKTERHNERKNEVYSNPDVVPERSGLNVYFKQCEGTYTQMFDKMLDDKVISTRGLKQDANVYAEMIFDVNSAYFERMGGYDYAKDFFAEAYRMAMKEAGGEEFILSAVMHADERNMSLSEELGKDVYHYHLHVVYIPVVDKEIKWTKRAKDPALRGQVKEVIKQVSHSKKWASEKAVDEQGNTLRREDGKVVLIPSYSLLQDRFFEHMANAGFTGFERGEKGSNAQHLSVMEFKCKQELERLDALENKILRRENNLKTLHKEIGAAKQVKKSVRELDGLGSKKTMLGEVKLPQKDFEELITLAKDGIVKRHENTSLLIELQQERKRYTDLKEQFNKLWWETKEYRMAMKLAPEMVKSRFQEIFKNHRERKRTRQKQRDEPTR